MFQLFRSFLPLHNPIGFGTSDFIELALAALLVLLIVAHAGLGGWARRLAARTGWCMLALAILPIEAFDVSALPVISASAQSDRLRHERFHRAGAGGTARLADRAE